MKQIKYLLSFFCIAMTLSLLPLQAEKVDADKAGRLAQRYVQSKRRLPSGDFVRLKYTATQRHRMDRTVPGRDAVQANVQDTVFYYVFNVAETAGGGFVIVSGDDTVTPVLGYSDNGSYDENNLPPNFAGWMDNLQDEIRWTISQKQPRTEIIQQKWDDYLSGNVSDYAVSSLIRTTWDQGSPYWDLCPMYSGKRSPTGCVATAMAQIMNYHRHPARGNGQSNAYTTKEHGINMPSVSFAVNYDWGNMLNSYKGTTTAQQRTAVATLMYHCGLSVQMDYSPDAGSAASSTDVPAALKNYFGYDSSCSYVSKLLYTSTTWETMIKGQLDAGFPVLYRGQGTNGGHAFVCDGYKDDGTFHFNWGWSGYADGWFVLTALNTDIGTFNTSQGMVINIKPAVNVPVTGVSLNKTTASIFVGGTEQLIATVAPSGATNKTLTWRSNSTGVATVNSSGVVTGVSAGTATITVTTQDGNKSATCTVTVSPSVPDANLSALSVNPGTLSPAFNANTTAYNVNVANSVTSITVSATPANASSTVAGTGNRSLNVGSNTIDVVVTAQNGTTKKTYTITVERAPAVTGDPFEPNNTVTLASSLTASFTNNTASVKTTGSNFHTNTDVDFYKITLPTGYSYTISSRLHDSYDSEDGNTYTVDAAYSCSTDGNNWSKFFDVNSTDIVLQNGGTVYFHVKPYFTGNMGTYLLDISIVRKQAGTGTNANLSALTVNPGTLTPAFNANTTAYNVSVANNVTSITVSATLADNNATVTGAGSHSLNVGNNTIDVVVTAQNGTTKKTYTITVERASPASGDLYEPNNTVAQAFSLPVTFTNNTATVKTTGSNFHSTTDVDYYKIDLPSGFNYTITARLHDSYSSDDGNTYSVDAEFRYSTNGSSWSEYYDDVMDNNIVIPNGGTLYFHVEPYFISRTGTYLLDITIVRKQAGTGTNANLSDLSVNPGTLTPAFNANTTAYNVTVANSVTSITVSATLADNNASVAGTGNRSLIVGNNTIDVVVTAQNGTTVKTYTITVERLPINPPDIYEPNNTLAQAYSLPVTFTNNTATVKTTGSNFHVSTDVDYYKIELPSNYSYTISARLHDYFRSSDGNNYTADAKFSYSTDGSSWSITYDYILSNNIILGDGGTVYFLVEPYFSTSWSTGTYLLEVTIERNAPDPYEPNNTLAQAYSLPVTFTDNAATVKTAGSYFHISTDVDYYKIELPLDYSYTITARLHDYYSSSDGNNYTADAKFSYSTNGSSWSVTYDAIMLNNIILNDGGTVYFLVQPYSSISHPIGTYLLDITIVRKKNASKNAGLSALSVNPGVLTPVFDVAVTEYSVHVENDIESITVSAAPSDVNATVSGMDIYLLNVGSNTISVTVTAEDGSTKKTYTITVVRDASSNADLGALSVNKGVLTPVFDADVTEYSVHVGNEIASITVTATAAHTNAEVTGTDDYSLIVGNNTITVTVTAEDGTTQKTYTITVVRDASSNADLKTLSVNQGDLTPVFNAATIQYSVNVESEIASITVSATPAHAGATVAGVGIHTLNVGSNTISVTVIAEDVTTQKTYTITVVRKKYTDVEDNYSNPLLAYPNPVQDQITISGLQGKGILSVYDAAGRIWIKRYITSTQEILFVNFLPQGSYIVQVDEGKNMRAIKILKIQ